MSQASLIYAKFWRRAGALLIDVLIGMPLFALQIALFSESIGGAVASLLIPGVVLASYPAYFHARWGQTIGKMVTKIRVVRLDGRPIDLRAALLRSSVDVVLWLIYTVATAAALLTWMGPEWSSLSWAEQSQMLRADSPLFGLYMWFSEAWMWSEVVVMLFNRKRRALHDFIAGTVVVVIAKQPASFVSPVADLDRPANA